MLTAAAVAQARPFLHDFMAAVYPFYDIVIWSATSMKWVEVKALPSRHLQPGRSRATWMPQSAVSCCIHSAQCKHYCGNELPTPPFVNQLALQNYMAAGVQVKMRELGVTCHSDYKVTLMMDHKSMVTVKTDKYGMFRCVAV